MPPKEPKERKVTFSKLVEAFQKIRSSDPLRYAAAVTIDNTHIKGKNEGELADAFIALMRGPRFSRSVRIALRRRKVNFFLSIFKCGYSSDPKFVAKCEKLHAEAVKEQAEAKREAAAEKAEKATKAAADATADAKATVTA